MQLEHPLVGIAVPEIELSYRSEINISDLPVVTTSKDAYQILMQTGIKVRLDL